MMVDQEGGSVQRLPGAPSRSAPEMAATGRTAVARAEGRATAATLRAAGMNVDLAPVVDVVRPESALHAEGRGFGFGAASAARFGAAFTRGLRAGGVAATAKHFPGFGAAPRNTDLGGVRIGVGLRELRRVDRVPFAAAVRAGTDLVMLSSATYPALSRAPAVLSPRVVQRELRDGLGFDGVTISDDLEAPAFAARGGPTGAALGAARAGVDLLLFARTFDGADRAARALAGALRAGRVDRPALEESLARVLALRAALR
jgi:beta-N-acetylhexosaminidase